MTVTNENEIAISYLPEMLEGQVAVLSSGYISGADSLELLNALKASALFRHDQYSYILYPNKELKRFSDKNNIPVKSVEKSALLQQLIKDGNKQIIEKDVLGNYHFNGNFNNAESLKAAFSQLSEDKYQSLIEKDKKLVLDKFLKEGETITFGNTTLKMLFTPGHSPGSLSFYCAEDKFVIAGDVLFYGSICRTDLPGGHFFDRDHQQ